MVKPSCRCLKGVPAMEWRRWLVWVAGGVSVGDRAEWVVGSTCGLVAEGRGKGIGRGLEVE